jgi:hypothetical protein
MQLTSKNNIANKTKKIVNVNTALAAATCTLLGTSAIVEAQETV